MSDSPVAILLSTFEGAPFLPLQLESFVAQGTGWHLYWRDDGSSDGTIGLMEAFAAGAGAGRCTRIDAGGHLGVTASYMALLGAALAGGAAAVAFSDQDDVWLPGKLARGLAALGEGPGPALYCSRQVLVDEAMRRVGVSHPVFVEPGLGPALTQNIATGCTVMLNRSAAELLAGSEPPAATLHDWWSYLLVSAAGGRIVADDEPSVLYRQHAANAVGAPASRRRRAIAAMQRGPQAFMAVMRAHVQGLLAHRGVLSAGAVTMVEAVAAAMDAGPARRLAVLRHYPLRRQTAVETWLFRWWFLIG